MFHTRLHGSSDPAHALAWQQLPELAGPTVCSWGWWQAIPMWLALLYTAAASAAWMAVLHSSRCSHSD